MPTSHVRTAKCLAVGFSAWPPLSRAAVLPGGHDLGALGAARADGSPRALLVPVIDIAGAAGVLARRGAAAVVTRLGRGRVGAVGEEARRALLAVELRRDLVLLVGARELLEVPPVSRREGSDLRVLLSEHAFSPCALST